MIILYIFNISIILCMPLTLLGDSAKCKAYSKVEAEYVQD